MTSQYHRQFEDDSESTRARLHQAGADAEQAAHDAELIAAWILWQRARNLSDKTIAERALIVSRVPRPSTLTPMEIDEFLVNPAWSKATRATYHGAIRAWSLWLVRTGHRTDDPTLIATTPRVPKGKPRPLADAHLVALLGSRTYRRTKAMILLAAYGGLRVGEIAGIRGTDVDLRSNTIRVTGKGDKQRDVPLHPLLQRLTAEMPTRSWWFPSWNGNKRGDVGGPMLANSVSATVSSAMKRAGVPGTPHALRHWFGTKLHELGAESLTIKELMGHESLATTSIYVDVTLPQRTQAINLLPDIFGSSL